MIHTVTKKSFSFIGLAITYMLTMSFDIHAVVSPEKIEARGQNAATQKGTCAKRTGGSGACKACCQAKKKENPKLSVPSCEAKCNGAKAQRAPARRK